MDNLLKYTKDLIPVILASSVISGIVSVIFNGIQKRKNSVFEKKQKVFPIIIDHIVTFIHDIPYSNDLNEFLQIQGESYLNFKLETDKYVLYFNKKETAILDKILKLFTRNISQDGVFDPNNPDDSYFNAEDRQRIIKLKDKLLLCFKKELGIVKLG